MARPDALPHHWSSFISGALPWEQLWWESEGAFLLVLCMLWWQATAVSSSTDDEESGGGRGSEPGQKEFLSWLDKDKDMKEGLPINNLWSRCGWEFSLEEGGQVKVNLEEQAGIDVNCIMNEFFSDL